MNNTRFTEVQIVHSVEASEIRTEAMCNKIFLFLKEALKKYFYVCRYRLQ
jgi:hypothetical protein